MAITKEQREERFNGIGSSEAAAACGLSRYMSPTELWAVKTRLVKPEDISDKLAVEVGSDLEGLVGRLFAKRTGKKVRRANITRVHKRYPFLRANLDFLVEGEDAVLEAKTAGAWAAKAWEDDVPQEYVIQVLHSLMVTGRQFGYVAVLVGGNAAFEWSRIERDDEVIAKLEKRLVEFWTKYVVPKVPPTLITKDDNDILQRLYPMGPDPEPLILGEEANKLADSLKALTADKRTLEGIIEKERNRLKAMLKEKALGETDRFKISWKEQIRRDLDVRELKDKKPEVWSEFSRSKTLRILRISEKKEKKK